MVSNGNNMVERFVLALILLGIMMCRADEERLHFVLNASQGGWPASLFSGPFRPEETVYCHASMDRCRNGEGVGGTEDGDGPTDASWCDVQEMMNASHVLVDCTKDNEEEEEEEEEEEYEQDVRVIPVECCEREVDEDAPVHTTPAGLLHYSTYSRNGPRNVIQGMRLLENMYKEELQKREETPVLTYFMYKDCCDENDEYLVDSNIPLRMQKSVRYQSPIYRPLNGTTTASIESKWSLARLAQEKGLNFKGGPFPVSFFSCSQALEAVQDPDALFYIKPSYAAWGKGIEVKTRRELSEMNEEGDCDFEDEEVIIQEGVTDLALIDGNRFDIRFYILVHNGRVYMHKNSNAKWINDGPSYNATNTEQTLDFVRKYSGDLVLSFMFGNATGKCKQWLDAIHQQLIVAMPALEPAINATAENDKLYQILGGDAMIRENGAAVIPEFNDWPSVRWEQKHQWASAFLDDNGKETGERTITRTAEMYEEYVSTMFADFFAIVLGLAKSEDDGTILEGRVREVVASPAVCADQTD